MTPGSPQTPSPLRRVPAILGLLAAVGLAGGIAAADLTDTLPEPGPEQELSVEDADPAAAAVGEAARAGAGTAVCPVVGDGEEPARLVIAAATDGESDVQLFRYRGGEPTAEPLGTVTADEPLTVDLDPAEAAEPVGVRWRGDPVVVSRLVGDAPAAAGPCEPYPQPAWQVVGFDTTLESEATLHLVNPYTTDAVVRVTFGTPDGESQLVRTDNILVGAGGHEALDVTDLEPEHTELAATVEVLTGRVVAQGEMVWDTPEGESGPEGRALLPAVPAAEPPDEDGDDPDSDPDPDPDPGPDDPGPGPDAAAADEPAGAPRHGRLAATGARVGDDATSWLVVHNRGDREEAFELAVTDPQEDNPRLLAEKGVPAGGVVRVDLADVSTALEFGVAIDPVGDARLAATRITAVTTSAGGQDLSAVPLTPPAERWAVAGGAAGRGRLSVARFASEPATATVDAGGHTPDDWAAHPLEPRHTTRFDLDAIPEPGPVPLRLDADAPVAAGLTRREGGAPLALWSLPPTDPAVWEATPRPPARRDPALPGRIDPPEADDEEAAEPEP